jgi:hypothetical protein
MAGISGLHVLLWLLLWGALLRTFEIKFHDSTSPLGSAARALAVIY